MSYQVLARKWRPKTFDQLVGQQHVVQALSNGLDQDRLHHAFLFTGTRGVGKTTIARILAKCLNCDQGVSSTPCGECSSCVDIDEGRFVDMLEIDAASRTKVDDTRELLESVQFTPSRGRYKIYIIDEVHMLSNSSFNALLKTLEEPPPHVKFVLATTDPERIPVTILSRCLRFNLTRLLPGQIEDHLEKLLTAEQINFEPGAVTLLARAADGSIRDGLSIMDQAITHGAGSLTHEQVKEMLGVVDHEQVATIVTALAEGDAERILAVVEILVAQSRDLETVMINLAEFMHRLVLVQCVPDYRDSERSDWDSMAQLATKLSAEDAQLFYQIAIKGRQDLNLAPDPRTGLEMTLLRMLAFRPATASAPTAAPVPPASIAKPRSGGVASTEATAAADSAVYSGQSTLPEQADQRQAPYSNTIGELPVAHDPVVMAVAEPSSEEWVSLLANLDIKGQVRELARNVQLESAGKNQWEFVISPSLSHLGSKGCVNRLEHAISERVGYPITVKLKDSMASGLITEAEIREEGSRLAESEAEKAIETDSTVQALKTQMGATVHKDSIQPLQ